MQHSDPLQVKGWGVFLLRAALFLHVTVRQPKAHSFVDDLAVFVAGDAPPQTVFGSLVKGGELAHQAGHKGGGGFVAQPCQGLQHGKAVLRVSGQG